MAQDRIDVSLHQTPDYLELRFSGRYSQGAIRGMIDQIASKSSLVECKRVVVDITSLAGAISDADRHDGAMYAAQLLRTRLTRMAILTTLRRPTYLFEDTARNRGLPVRAFTEREAALDWIKEK